MSEHTYRGGELELFAEARHWKAYWSSIIHDYIRGDVLEVGAGLGANTLLLRNGAETRWVCLEPDPQLVTAIEQRLAGGAPGGDLEVRRGTTASLGREERFNAILYI